jgi:acyl-CoA reductase-like NAD-dependent aldehyde dehydrogenase
VQALGHQEPDLAFQSARAAFAAQRSLALAERLAEISLLKAGILAKREEIVERVMAEVGKCRTDALIAEIIGTIDWLQWLERNAHAVLANPILASAAR